MYKLRITNNQEKTYEISEIKSCEKLSGEPDSVEYVINEKEKNELLDVYEKRLQSLTIQKEKGQNEEEIKKIEEKEVQIQAKIDDIDIPIIISGIDGSFGENPDKYFKITFENGKIQTFAFQGDIELIEIPVQENVVSTW